MHVETLIIGAGPAGLTTAYELTKAGRSVAVLERDPIYVGGISRTVNYKGYRFDIGGHRFFSKSSRGRGMWTEILGDEHARPPALLAASTTTASSSTTRCEPARPSSSSARSRPLRCVLSYA